MAHLACVCVFVCVCVSVSVCLLERKKEKGRAVFLSFFLSPSLPHAPPPLSLPPPLHQRHTAAAGPPQIMNAHDGTTRYVQTDGYYYYAAMEYGDCKEVTPA